MVRLKVLFPNKPGSNFDWDYYKSTHHPQVEEKLKGNGLLKYEIDKGIGTAEPGKPAPYIMIANLTFNSIDDVQSVFKKHSESIMADIPNFTDVQPEIQISEVVD
jgi:uncharacterized protein (TIGR02118 family)